MRLAGVLLAVFGVTFGIFFWLMKKDARDRGAEFEGRRTGIEDARDGVRPRTVGDASETPKTPETAAPARPGLDAGFPEAARRELGVVDISFDVEDGFRFTDVAAALTPHSGTVWRRDFRGVVFIDVEPGVYDAAVQIPGAIPHAVSQIVVEAGKVAKLAFPVAAGVPFGGKVTEGASQAPIAGAVVRAGNLKLTTRSDGTFRTPDGVLVNPKSLATVIVEHPDYDRLETRPVNVQNTLEYGFALTRGACRLIGRFILPEGVAEPPETAIVRLMRRFEARSETRREIVVQRSMDFEITGVQADTYELVVEFPGAQWPRFYAHVPLDVDPEHLVEIPFGKGGRVHGSIMFHGRPRSGEVFDVVDPQGRIYLEGAANANGAFSVGPLPQGEYAFRFKNRHPFLQTEMFTVPNDLALSVDVDFDLGKVRPRK